MNGYLFDTCVVRNWFARNPAVEAEVDSLDSKSLLYLSAITLGEIEFHHFSPNATDKAKQASFRQWIAGAFQIHELAVTSATAMEYAKIRRLLFSKSTPRGKYTENREDMLGTKLGVDENDLWLVAQAFERGLQLVTNDKMEVIREALDDLYFPQLSLFPTVLVAK